MDRGFETTLGRWLRARGRATNTKRRFGALQPAVRMNDCYYPLAFSSVPKKLTPETGRSKYDRFHGERSSASPRSGATRSEEASANELLRGVCLFSERPVADGSPN
jgi:hypothetical protein